MGVVTSLQSSRVNEVNGENLQNPPIKNPGYANGPKRTWREVVEKDCQAHKLNKEDAMDRSKWRKLIKDVQ